MEDVLARYRELDGASLEVIPRGLINRTYRVRSAAGEYVLQRLNPIFDPRLHFNILAVTERLAERGVGTPRLVRAAGGGLWADLGEGGVWRLMTFVPGSSFDRVADPEQAREGARLVGRFHQALDGLDHPWVGLRQGVHDTARHLETLEEALRKHRGHRLHRQIEALGSGILARARELPPLPALPPRVAHGDLKFNNLVFAGKEAVALVDLDTVGPMSLAFEVGDLWRSWCNPHGEDREDGAFDIGIFAASLTGYREGYGRGFDEVERKALLLGPEWVSLELAARFAADALSESYFGWDKARFPGRGEHNLVRARGQWSLFESVVRARTERAALLGA